MIGKCFFLALLTTLFLGGCDYFDPYAAAWFPEPPTEPLVVTAPAKTGQTTSYAAGDDGDLTGLMWDLNGSRFGTRTWVQALDDSGSLF